MSEAETRQAYREGYEDGRAASTRAAVIAELERIAGRICLFCNLGNAPLPINGIERVFEHRHNFHVGGEDRCKASDVHARIAQLRAEHGNEQTGEGDNG